MRFRVGILGTPVSSANRGVRALSASLANLCVGAEGQGEVTLFLGHADNRPAPMRIHGERRLVPVVNCRLSPRARPRDHLAWIVLASLLYRLLPIRGLRRWLGRATPWVRELEQQDLVGDVWGGDSFSDIYGLRPFLCECLTAGSVLLVKGTMVQFPQTYGPYRSPLARWLARQLLRRSSVIIARDSQSQDVAQSLVGPGRTIWLSPDVAFVLEAVRPERIELDPPLAQPAPQGPIGVNVNGLMFNGGYTRQNMFGLRLDYAAFLPELIAALLREHAGEVWLVPHTYGPPGDVESDPEGCLRVRAALPVEAQARVRIVTGEYDCHEIKGVIGQCGFFVGSRMHACIAALSQGIPCVGVAYSRKFAGVFESVGMGGWVVDGRTASNEEAVARTVGLYRLRERVREELSRRASQAREQLRGVFQRLRETVGTSGRGSQTRLVEEPLRRRVASRGNAALRESLPSQ